MSVENLLKEGALELGIDLTQEQEEKFLDYLALLLEWNKKINLTAVNKPDEIVIKHFLDSLTVLPYIGEHTNLLDIGTGAGFPGIPLAIVNNTLKVSLLDSTEKKVFFLNHVSRELGLKNITSFHARAEDKNNGVPRGSFDCVVTRAVGEMKEVADLSSEYIDKDGNIILMRGREGISESENFDHSSYEIKDLKELTVPKSDLRRVLIVLKKGKAGDLPFKS